jgi:hypothetical protein
LMVVCGTLSGVEPCEYNCKVYLEENGAYLLEYKEHFYRISAPIHLESCPCSGLRD